MCNTGVVRYDIRGGVNGRNQFRPTHAATGIDNIQRGESPYNFVRSRALGARANDDRAAYAVF
jgi:hypothetical protein